MTDTPRYVLAPYLPTPKEVVDRMIALAGVQPHDVVYDLGCGDGRLVIGAARLGARGLGVDIEPYWVEQSRTNADLAGVADLARFEHADAMHFDLTPATVVFLYLVDWSTRRISRELVKRCTPGTRVVSHSFAFTEFPAARTESFVDADGRTRSIHLWVIPTAHAAE